VAPNDRAARIGQSIDIVMLVVWAGSAGAYFATDGLVWRKPSPPTSSASQTTVPAGAKRLLKSVMTEDHEPEGTHFTLF
jgi:hypothetical protein